MFARLLVEKGIFIKEEFLEMVKTVSLKIKKRDKAIFRIKEAEYGLKTLATGTE
jgi:hypothetical protein